MQNLINLITFLFCIYTLFPINVFSRSTKIENFLSEITLYKSTINNFYVKIFDFDMFYTFLLPSQDTLKNLFSDIQFGDDFLVNDDLTDKNQMFPTIAMNDSGYFVISWVDVRNNNLDIYLQRFDKKGNKLGRNIKVNDDNTSEDQMLPSIGIDKYGNFIVTWMDRRNRNYDIYFQRYNSSGLKLGNNKKVNDDTGLEMQLNPKIAVMRNGNFIIVWEDLRSGKSDIYFQRYDSSGNPIGTNVKIYTDPGVTSQKSKPSIAIDDSGNFIIAWLDFRTVLPNVYIQMYNNQGIAIGQNILVNSINSANNSPVVINNPNGGFIVVWEDRRNNNSDIYLQIFDKNGAYIDGNKRINNDFGNSSQIIPSISHDRNQKFIVVWLDNRNDPNNSEIVGQKFLNSGEPILSNFILVKPDSNQTISDPQIDSNDSSIVLCWTDNRRSKGLDIYGKIVSWDWIGISNSEYETKEPIKITLYQNYPNPFNSSTRISWFSPYDEWTTLKIFDVFGREIVTLVDEFKKAGNHDIILNLSSLSSGIYFYQLQMGNYRNTKKMILVK